MENILRTSRQDWMYIILSTLSGFFMVGFYLFLKDVIGLNEFTSFMIIILLFSFFFDVRHFFSTYSRTFLDKSYLQENKSWLTGSTLFIFLVPMIVYLILMQLGAESNNAVFAYNGSIILVFARRVTLVLGFYHLVKQNWGFMAIYKKKFNEPEDGSDRWEKLLLLSGSFLPLLYAAKTYKVWFGDEIYVFNPKAADVAYLDAFWVKIAAFVFILALAFLLVGFVFKSKAQYKFVSRNLGFYFLAIFAFIRLALVYGVDPILDVLLSGAGIIFVVSLVFTIQKALQFGKFNTRKWAVLISALVLYSGIILLPIENKAIMVMGITIPHNIQYMTFVSFFSSKYYQNSSKNHGLAKTLSQKIILFFFASLIFSVVFELGRTGTIFFADVDSYILKNTVAIFFLSFVLHHYYLDAVIWRVRKDKDLSKTL